MEHSNKGNLVTFGVFPNKPETGYGYIEVERKINQKELTGLSVKSFIEKPDLETAKKFLFSKRYFWNSGIFLFKASVIINEMKILCPEIYKVCLDTFNFSTVDLDFLSLIRNFNNCPDISLIKLLWKKQN